VPHPPAFSTSASGTIEAEPTWSPIMLLQMDSSAALRYKGRTQMDRVVTEQWVDQNVYCASCKRRVPGLGFSKHAPRLTPLL
jgi:hypothetical protein